MDDSLTATISASGIIISLSAKTLVVVTDKL